MLDAHCEESSTDDIDNLNNDGYVIFVGDNIIIGRSNLRKENTTTSKKVSLFLCNFILIKGLKHFNLYKTYNYYNSIEN